MRYVPGVNAAHDCRAPRGRYVSASPIAMRVWFQNHRPGWGSAPGAGFVTGQGLLAWHAPREEQLIIQGIAAFGHRPRGSGWCQKSLVIAANGSRGERGLKHHEVLRVPGWTGGAAGWLVATLRGGV